MKKYFDNFVIAAQEEDKSPDIRQKKKKLFSKNENLEVKPKYLDRTQVQSRLFGEINSNSDIDWKNLEKLSKEAIGKADMPMNRLVSLKKVLDNEIVRLQKQDLKYDKELKMKVRCIYYPIL